MDKNKSNFFSYAGFHFKLCSLELRELFAHIFESNNFADMVRHHLIDVQEFVPIYTCNRFDICFFGETHKENVAELFWELAIQALKTRFEQPQDQRFPQQNILDYAELKTHILDSLRFSTDRDGLVLFLKVASSLDSLVLGETQILGQIKKAYDAAKKRGFVHNRAAQIFDHCFRVSKRIRNETDLFKNVVSIGHLAVELAQKEFNNISNKNIIIFGAGEIALLTAKHFVFHGAKKLFITNRTFKNAHWICQKIGNGTPLELSHAIQNIAQFDICIAACGGDDLLITPKYFTDYENKRNKQNTLLIDISVPRKIDPNLSSLPNLKLFNIDQLADIIKQNKEARMNAIQISENIILKEVDSFLEKLRKCDDIKSARHFNSWLNNIVQTEVDRFLNQKSKNKSISSSVIARSICKKVNAKMRDKWES